MILMHRQEIYIDEKGYSEYWKIRLGHFIGQEDHEYGDVSPINKNVAEPGMIFSIEPGIYIEGKYGVRIEDLVLVTEDGHEVLNKVDKEIPHCRLIKRYLFSTFNARFSNRLFTFCLKTGHCYCFYVMFL